MKIVQFDNKAEAESFRRSLKRQGITAKRIDNEVFTHADYRQIREVWLRLCRIPNHRIFEL